MMIMMCLILARASASALALDMGVSVGAVVAGVVECGLLLPGSPVVGFATCLLVSEQAGSIALSISKDMSRAFFLISSFFTGCSP